MNRGNNPFLTIIIDHKLIINRLLSTKMYFKSIITEKGQTGDV